MSTTFSRAIVCLGDSLTEGYLRRGTKFHPYTNKLQSLLDKGIV